MLLRGKLIIDKQKSVFAAEDTWNVLVQYKMLEDRVIELRALAERGLKGDKEVEEGIEEVENELAKLKAWISMNYGTKRVD